MSDLRVSGTFGVAFERSNDEVTFLRTKSIDYVHDFGNSVYCRWLLPDRRVDCGQSQTRTSEQGGEDLRTKGEVVLLCTESFDRFLTQ